MGFATVYCDKCGAQILGGELEKGHAVARGEKYFCAECSPSLPPVAPGTPGERKGSTKVRKPSESGKNTDIIRNLQAMGGSRGNTVRVQAIEPPSGGLGTGAKVGISICGLAILILVGIVVSQAGNSGGGSGAGGGKPDTSKARAACEAAEALRGSANPRAWVEAAQRAKRESSGTEFADRATELVREAQLALEALEKAEGLQAEARRLATDARAAEDPFTYDGAFRDLSARAKRDAPALVDQIDGWWKEIVQSALLKMLNKVDVSMATTPAGYRRVKEDLDEVATKAASAGPAGKTAAEQVAKKLKEALEKFNAGAEPALAELVKRVTQMLDDMALDEADRAISGFVTDYAGSAVAEKTAPLKEKLAARRKEIANATWIEPVEADWQSEPGDAKITFDGKEIRFTCDGPAGQSPETDPDKSRRIVLKKADSNWKDYDLEFEVFIEEHGGTLVVRGGGNNANAHLLNFLPVNAAGQGLPKNQWFKLTTKVMGNKLKIAVGNNALQEFPTTSTSGTVMFIGYKGSKFKIRNLRIRRLR